jgi:hypothetical protein
MDFSFVRQRLSPGQDFNLAGRSNIYASDARIVADFMAGNAELTEAALVRRWLEETASEFPAVEVRKGYYPHTFKALKDKQRLKLAEGSLVKELDPDAQLRMKGVLDIGDQVGCSGNCPIEVPVSSRIAAIRSFRNTTTISAGRFTPTFEGVRQKMLSIFASKVTNLGVRPASWEPCCMPTMSWVG